MTTVSTILPNTRVHGSSASSPGNTRRPTAGPELLNGNLWIDFLPDANELSTMALDWDDLAEDSIEPNIFLERWFVEAALKAFGHPAPAAVVVQRRGKRNDVAPAIVGLFLFERGRYPKTPIACWRPWQHDYCFLNTPLIRNGHAPDVLATLFDWIEKLPGGPAVIDWPLIHGEGPFQQALVEVLYQRQSLTFLSQHYNRAFLRRAVVADASPEDAISSHQRQELRRQLRRLQEQGPVEFRSWPAGSAATSTAPDTSSKICDDLASWTDAFFKVEAAGWKGTEQTALGSGDQTRSFFQALTQGAAAQHKLRLIGLFLNDQPIAVKVNFMSGPGSYAFKIGYDEAFAKYSPGVQLELENIRLLHTEPSWKWMDSCAIPDHPMINRLWSERRTIQHLTISTGRRSGDLLVGMLPLLRGLKRAVSRKRKPPVR